jgi:hypothetical protein
MHAQRRQQKAIDYVSRYSAYSVEFFFLASFQKELSSVAGDDSQIPFAPMLPGQGGQLIGLRSLSACSWGRLAWKRLSGAPFRYRQSLE